VSDELHEATGLEEAGLNQVAGPGDQAMREYIGFVSASLLLALAAGPIRAADEPQFGRVALPQGMTIELHSSITGTGAAAALPAGRHTVYQWSLRRTDEQGVPWMCQGYVPNSKNGLDVVPQQEMTLSVGEPLVSVVTAVRRGPELTFSHHLEDRSGESVRLYRNGVAAPEPKLRIKNADGSYDQSLSFTTYHSGGGKTLGSGSS
jgi:hypothetical protein